MKSLYHKSYRQLLHRLREARKHAGLTQVQVAKALRKPQSFVSKVEVGERRIDPIELKILAQLYKMPITHFYQGLS